MNSLSMMKRPSAFLPMAMSFVALAIVLGHITIFGVAREADEGPTAHIFQLLMISQLPIIIFFAIKWLRRDPRQTLLVIALQLVVAVATLAPVFAFNL
jgi:hypothetical protein